MQFKTKPFAHQLKQFEQFKNEPFWALFADMGTGKTKSTIDIAANHFNHDRITALVVVAPNGVHRQWAEEQLPTHCPVAYTVCTWQPNMTKAWKQTFEAMSTSRGLRVFCVNVEAFQSAKITDVLLNFLDHNKVMLVVDEATRIKNNRSIRTKTLTSFSRHHNTVVRAILTGTPVAQGPLGLYSMYNFLKPKFFPESLTAFRSTYAILMLRTMMIAGSTVQKEDVLDEYTWKMIRKDIAHSVSIFGKLTVQECDRIGQNRTVRSSSVAVISEQPSFCRYINIDALKKRIDPYTITITKEECLDLPPKLYTQTTLPLTKAQTQLLRDLKRLGAAVHGEHVLTTKNAAAIGTRILQICSGVLAYDTEDLDTPYSATLLAEQPKIDALLTALEDFPHQAIVWCQFVPELINVHSRLVEEGLTAVAYHGSVTPEERTAALSAFTKGATQFLVANPATAGTGLNLQCAQYQFWLSRGWSVEHRLQAEDRSHRNGVAGSVTYTDILMDTPFERRVLEALRGGKDLNTFFTTTSVDALLGNI